MKCRLAKLVYILALLAPMAYAGDLLDRIVATVNQKPILASDLDDAAHFEALQRGTLPGAMEINRRAVLNRVIERELICQQMPDTFEPTQEAIENHIREIRTQFPTAKSDVAWSDLLASFGFDDSSLRDDVRLQLKVVHFLDVRLRPTVRVESEEVSDYYSKTLVPRLKAAGATAEPMDKLKDKIQEVLLQQKMTEVFDAWVANLKSQGSIRVLDPELSTPTSAAPDKGARSSQ